MNVTWASDLGAWVGVEVLTRCGDCKAAKTVCHRCGRSEHGETGSGGGYGLPRLALVPSRCQWGCIIAVRGYTEIPLQFDEVAVVRVNHKRWNFRD
jgi:hypothetical protein